MHPLTDNTSGRIQVGNTVGGIKVENALGRIKLSIRSFPQIDTRLCRFFAAFPSTLGRAMPRTYITVILLYLPFKYRLLLNIEC